MSLRTFCMQKKKEMKLVSGFVSTEWISIQEKSVYA